MKRLTTRLSKSIASWNYPDYCYSENEAMNKLFRSEHKRNVCERLAAIEDILCDGEDEYDLDRLATMCNQRMSLRDEVSERFSLTAKIPLDRLRELVEADRDGRCVVLPCKNGDPVWRLYDDCDFPGDCYTKQKCRGCEYRNLFIEEQAFCLSMLSQNGKLGPPYYTTRAEAEAARREQNG